MKLTSGSCSGITSHMKTHESFHHLSETIEDPIISLYKNLVFANIVYYKIYHMIHLTKSYSSFK